MDTGTIATIGIILCVLAYLGSKAPLRKNVKLSAVAFLVGIVFFGSKKMIADMGWGFRWSWEFVILSSVGLAILVLLFGHKIPARNADRAEQDGDGNAETPPGVERKS